MLDMIPKSSLKHSMIFVSGLILGCVLMYFFHSTRIIRNDHFRVEWYGQMQDEQVILNDLKDQSEQNLENLVKKLATMQAQMVLVQTNIRQLALKLGVSVADFDTKIPTQLKIKDEATPQDIYQTIASLDYRLSQRTQQLQAFSDMFQDKKATEALMLKGKSSQIVKGNISSYFGMRPDPFTGKQTWHSGVDIASQPGSEIKAIASGVVSFVGAKGGYGNLLEIDHGDGLVTRYGHNQSILVKKGDVVHKGTAIARVGDSGKATGYHLHFEVRENGEAVDPAKYVPDLKDSA